MPKKLTTKKERRDFYIAFWTDYYQQLKAELEANPHDYNLCARIQYYEGLLVGLKMSFD